MPDWKLEIRTAIAGLNLEPTREEDVIEELSQHLRDRYDELLLKGTSEAQATMALRAELQDGSLLRGLSKVVRRAHEPLAAGSSGSAKFPGGFGRDLRYAARQLWKNKSFTIVAILSLALGVGANTAIFQQIDTLMLRMLPVKDPKQLAYIRIGNDNEGARAGSFVTSHSDFTSNMWNLLQSQQQGFSTVAAWSSGEQNLNQGGEARPAQTLMVSGSFFPMLGVQPVMGRLITPSDDHRDCGAQTAVISYGFWQREYGGREDILGTKISLDRQLFQIVGITPPAFHGVNIGDDFDVAMPLCSEKVFYSEKPAEDTPDTWWLAVIGRLKPDWTLEKASAQLRAISPGIFKASMPPDYDAVLKTGFLKLRLEAVRGDKGVSSMGHGDADPLYVLLALSGLVLLLACTNLANLLLAKASARQREMALRLTLGASRTRLLVQVLIESLMLAVFGTIAGLGLAQLLSRALIAILTSGRKIFIEVHMDWRVLVFTAALGIVTCILFGLTPALQASRTDPGVAMKAGGRGATAGRERFMLRRALVIAQVAFSLMLLVGALLFARSFRNLLTLDPGFQQDHLLIASFDYSPLKMPVERRASFKRELIDRMRAIPGVQSVAGVFIVPVGHRGWDFPVDIPNGPQRQDVQMNSVTSGYFETMHIPILAGRDFNESETPNSPPVIIVNEFLAKKYFGTTNVIGKIITESSDTQSKKHEIVGVVGNTKYHNMREDFQPLMYFANSQEKEAGEGQNLVIRSNESMESLAASVKRVSQQMAPAMTLKLTVMHTQISDGLAGDRAMAILTGFFGVLATLLAMVGIYGVISYMVALRKSEIGVRMALGAERKGIVIMVLRESLILLIIGAAIGTTLTLAASKAASSMLYGLKAYDPITIGGSLIMLAIIMMLASLLPARRAAAVDPMVVLREE